jgi:hypothetical protein
LSARGCAGQIAFHSPSKAWNLAGLKCALILTGHSRQQEVLDRLPHEVPWSVGHLGLLAATAAYNDGEPWRQELLAALEANATLLTDLLAKYLPAIRCTPPQASYLACWTAAPCTWALIPPATDELARLHRNPRDPIRTQETRRSRGALGPSITTASSRWRSTTGTTEGWYVRSYSRGRGAA